LAGLKSVNLTFQENEPSPFFMKKCAPSITCEKEALSRYQPGTEEIVIFVSPLSQYRNDNFTVELNSPDKKFSPENRRLQLEVDVGENMDYILIGRDWQEGFELTFKAFEIIIQEQ